MPRNNHTRAAAALVFSLFIVSNCQEITAQELWSNVANLNGIVKEEFTVDLTSLTGTLVRSIQRTAVSEDGRLVAWGARSGHFGLLDKKGALKFFDQRSFDGSPWKNTVSSNWAWSNAKNVQGLFVSNESKCMVVAFGSGVILQFDLNGNLLAECDLVV